MSRERELLERVRDTLLELKETHYDLYWDIQTALDLREDLREGISLRDINTQYLLDQVSRLTAENAMIKEKWLEAQPEQEPVAWRYIYDDGITVRERVTECMPLGEHYTITPLYTAPPKREPLSDETIAKLWGESYSGTTQMVRNFARAIEKAHGIGGGK